MPDMTQRERALARFHATSVLRTRDFTAAGIARETLRRLVQDGAVEQIERGLYRLATHEITEYHTLLEVAARVPQGIICLLSALQFHGLTTQQPFEIWIALDARMRHPQLHALPVRWVHLSGAALTEDIEEHQIEGVTVHVYALAKTITDCFKYRNMIGLDTALESLRDAWRQRRVTMDELWQAAKVDRVTTIMRPYLEALEIFI